MFRLVTATTALLLAMSMQSTAAQGRAGDVTHLTLEQRFGRALYSTCQLNVVLDPVAGRATARCVRNSSPPRNAMGERALRREEVTVLTTLVAESALLANPGTGTDATPADGIYETLTSEKDGQTVVLITSGNQTFESGNRKRLLDRLHSLFDELLAQRQTR